MYVVFTLFAFSGKTITLHFSVSLIPAFDDLLYLLRMITLHCWLTPAYRKASHKKDSRETFRGRDYIVTGAEERCYWQRLKNRQEALVGLIMEEPRGQADTLDMCFLDDRLVVLVV